MQTEAIAAQAIATMLPIQDGAVLPDAGRSSGSAKRARRNELPAAVLMFEATPSQPTPFLMGMMSVDRVEWFDHGEFTSDQLWMHIEKGGDLNPDKYITWYVDRVSGFIGGPVALAPEHLTFQSLVFSGLSAAGMEHVASLRLRVGREEVALSQFLTGSRWRLFKLHWPIAARVLRGDLKTIVTGLAHASQAGLRMPERTAPAHDVHPVGLQQRGAAGLVEPCGAEDDQGEHADNAAHFPPEVLFAALRLNALLRDKSKLGLAVNLAVQVLGTVAPHHTQAINEYIDQGGLRLPKSTALASGWIKLDCMAVLYERSLLNHSDFKRYLMADASAKQWNYLCVRETTIRLPLGGWPGKVMDSVALSQVWSTHAWQCTVLGHGAANLGFKFRNVLHSMLLICGDEEQLRRFRLSVIAWTSDQGTERKLADAALADQPNLERLRNICQKVSFEGLELGCNAALQVYLFPNCLYMPGHQHLLFNGLEESVKRSPLWSSGFSEGLHAMVSMLNSRGLRDRFVMTCMKDAPAFEQEALKHFAKKHLDWRWESFGELLTCLCPLVPIFLKYWSLSAMKGGTNGLSLIDPSDLTKVDSFLQARWLRPCLEMLRVVSMTVNRWSSWMEGCSCHEVVWTGKGTWEQKRQRLQSEFGIADCPWKGCRGSAMAAGGVNEFLDDIIACDSSEFKMLLADMVPGERPHVVAAMHSLKEWLYEVYDAKFGMWRHLPYILLGMAHPDMRKAKLCAQIALSEWRTSEQRKVHRVALRFFSDPVISHQLATFADPATNMDLTELAALHNLTLEYSLISLVERQIEGEHAKIEWATTSGSMTPAMVCAKIRSSYLFDLLNVEHFKAWANFNWNSKYLRRLLCAVIGNEDALQGWSREKALEKIYLYGLGEQFAHTCAPAEALRQWEAARKRALRPALRPLPIAKALCLSWLRAHMRSGQLLALPSAMVIEATLGRSVEAEASCSLDELFDVIAEVDDAQDMPHDMTVFKVINSNPKSRITQHTWHMGGKPHVVRVALYRLEELATDAATIWPFARCVDLDLEHLATSFPTTMKTLCAFMQTQRGCRLEVKPDVALRLPDMIISGPTLLDAPQESQAIVPEEMGLVVSPPAPDIETLLAIGERGCFIEVGRFVPVSFGPGPISHHKKQCLFPRASRSRLVLFGCVDRNASCFERPAPGALEVSQLRQFSIESLQVLQAAGVMGLRTDDFGEEEVAARMSAFQWRLFLRCSALTPKVSVMECGRDSRKASKIDLLVALHRQGFAGGATLSSWTPASGDKYSEAMAARGSKLYLICLLRRDDILSRGASEILHRGPAKYYLSLLACPSLDMVQAIVSSGERSAVAFDGALKTAGVSETDWGDESDDGEDMLALEESGSPPIETQGFEAASSMAAPHTLPAMPGSTTMVPVVHFDNYSHASGHLRAYSRCVCGAMRGALNMCR